MKIVTEQPKTQIGFGGWEEWNATDVVKTVKDKVIDFANNTIRGGANSREREREIILVAMIVHVILLALIMQLLAL